MHELDKLEVWRRQNKVTYSALARALGVSRQAVYYFMQKRAVSPRMAKRLQRITKGYVSAARLVFGDEAST